MTANDNGARLVYVSPVNDGQQPRMFEDEPDVLDVKQVAALLGVDTKTIRREIAKGRLGCFRVGKCVRITKGQLLEYVRSNHG